MKTNEKNFFVLTVGALMLVLLGFFAFKPLRPSKPVIVSSYEEKDFPQSDQDTIAALSAQILADTTNVWRTEFSRYGAPYKPPRIVMYAGKSDSPCGAAYTQNGPFYCPADKSLYLDSGFLFTLKYARNLPGDFAVAYAISHEIGHHVQNEWGILAELGRMPEPKNHDEYQVLPAKIETMADCLAGVWASKQKGKLEPKTIKTGIETAGNLEKLYPDNSGVKIVKPRSHGTVKDRITWFTRGYKSGAMTSCNTFWE